MWCFERARPRSSGSTGEQLQLGPSHSCSAAFPQLPPRAIIVATSAKRAPARRHAACAAPRPLCARSALAYVQVLLRDRDFGAFWQPVPRDTPDYYQVIERPMDLGTIRGGQVALSWRL